VHKEKVTGLYAFDSSLRSICKPGVASYGLSVGLSAECRRPVKSRDVDASRGFLRFDEVGEREPRLAKPEGTAKKWQVKDFSARVPLRRPRVVHRGDRRCELLF
jgi:hypothetical protein